MKNSSTKNAVSTPAIKIETKISANGAANVYVNGKRTSNEKAVKIAEANGLPTYRAVCYTYSQSNNSIDETLATALSAYKWLVRKGKGNRNVANGSWEIERLTDHKVIYEFDERNETINADDEPEFATFIYAENGAIHIADQLYEMQSQITFLVNDGLTEEQAEQVILARYLHQKTTQMIKDFKAANGIVEESPAEKARRAAERAGVDTKGEFGITVIGNNDVKVNVRPDCKIVALQCQLYVATFCLGAYEFHADAEQAAEDLKAAIKNGAGEYRINPYEVDPYDYLIDKDAFNVAVEAEIELAAENHIAEQFKAVRKFAEKLIGGQGLTEEQANAVIVHFYAENGNAESVKKLIDDFKAANFKEAQEVAARLEEIIADEAKRAADKPTPEIEINPDGTGGEPEITATRLEFNSVNEALETWLSRYWPIDNYIHAEDDDGNEVEFTDADVAAIEKSLRGKYYIHRTGDGVEFFAENCTASLLSAICTELEDRGCYIEDYHYAWKEERELCEVPDEPPASESSILEHMNSNAPDGWSVVHADDKIRVEYQGKHVADAEQFTKRELLAPHSFFQQFQPLVDKSKTPDQMFLDDRYRELAELEEMRKSPDCTPDARKKIDEMIERYKRDIAKAEFDDRDTVTSFCKSGAIDEHGNIYF